MTARMTMTARGITMTARDDNKPASKPAPTVATAPTRATTNSYQLEVSIPDVGKEYVYISH